MGLDISDWIVRAPLEGIIGGVEVIDLRLTYSHTASKASSVQRFSNFLASCSIVLTRWTIDDVWQVAIVISLEATTTTTVQYLQRQTTS